MLPVTNRDHQPKRILDTALRLLHRRRRAFIRRNRYRIIGGCILFTCWITLLWLHRRVGDTAVSAAAGAALQQGQGGNGSLRTLAHFTGPALVSAPHIAAAVPPYLAAASADNSATLLISV